LPSMPYYYVGKGSQFSLLDDQFGGAKNARESAYDAALSRLEATPLAELAARHNEKRANAYRLTDTDVQHFQDHWLKEWWPKHRVEDVLRAGFAAAIQRAKDAGLPLEALWVCADEDAFQVYICQGPNQVTVLVFTPPPIEHVADETLTEPEQIWVVKQRDKWDKGEFDVLSTDRKGSDIIQKQLAYAPDPRAAS
jgi:hypothetical protein